MFIWGVVLLLLGHNAHAAVVSYDLVYKRVDLSPDGFEKSVITINGVFPGPTIRANVGDTLVVNVTNSLNTEEDPEFLSVHYHGIDQIGSPWSDGLPFVTNCPIAGGDTYSYVFTVYTSGTYWYHSHIEGYRGDGGYGFLIVEDEGEGIGVPYDEEKLVILTDWYHQSAAIIDAGLRSYGPSSSTGVTPTTGFLFPGVGQSILINGVGSCSSLEPGCKGAAGPKASIAVDHGKVYRFRILNAASLAYFNFAIAAHNLTVVMEQTQLVKHVTLDSLDLASGQRFDVIVWADKPAAKYHLRVQTNWRGTDQTAAGVYDGYLTYSRSNYTDPTPPKNESKLWNEQLDVIQALEENSSVPPSTMTILINAGQQYVNSSFYGLDYTATNTHGYLRWTQNGISFKKPSTPLLLASYYGLLDSNLFETASRPIRIELGAVVDIIIQNHAATNKKCEAHPWHIHGNDFWVLGYGSGAYNESRDKPTLNVVNPLELDTIVSYPTSYASRRDAPVQLAPADYAPCGWTVVRFKADNPGIWMMHCHVAWHLTIGMGIVFDVASEVLWKTHDLPAHFGFCGQIDSTTKRQSTTSGRLLRGR